MNVNAKAKIDEAKVKEVALKAGNAAAAALSYAAACAIAVRTAFSTNASAATWEFASSAEKAATILACVAAVLACVAILAFADEFAYAAEGRPDAWAPFAKAFVAARGAFGKDPEPDPDRGERLLRERSKKAERAAMASRGEEGTIVQERLEKKKKKR